MTALAVILVCSGAFFLFMGAVGLLRFPDFFTRMHAAGKCDTLGSLLLLTGLACYRGLDLVSVKILPDCSLHLPDKPNRNSRNREGRTQAQGGLLAEGGAVDDLAARHRLARVYRSLRVRGRDRQGPIGLGHPIGCVRACSCASCGPRWGP